MELGKNGEGALRMLKKIQVCDNRSDLKISHFLACGDFRHMQEIFPNSNVGPR